MENGMYHYTVKDPMFDHVINKSRVHKLTEIMAKNGGYCPCSLIQDDTTLCQCSEYRNSGICRCGLYIKPGESG